MKYLWYLKEIMWGYYSARHTQITDNSQDGYEQMSKVRVVKLQEICNMKNKCVSL